MPANLLNSSHTVPAVAKPLAIEAVPLAASRLADGATASKPNEGPESIPPTSRRSGGGRAVLVVDSTPIARNFMRLRLQRLGYEVHEAEAGEQALEMIEKRAYAIVFLEAILEPKDGLDGLSLCHAVKKRADPPGSPCPAVVIVTRLTSSSDKVRGWLAGCNAYLTKPLDQDEFFNALAQVDPLFH